jgi:hypothetical protein
VKNQRGVVYLEMLIGFLPVFMFFLGTLQVADASVAHLVVEHAATTAARAAVVVLPDDGAYYEDEDNTIVDEFRDYRQSDVERAADTILAANGRLDRNFTNVALDKPKYEERELVTAQVTAPYHCLVRVFCPGGLTISANAQLVYQGAKYKYEPSTGWASSAANRGLDNLRGNKAEPGKKNADEDPNATKPDDDTTKPDDDTTKPDDDTTKPDDDATKADDDATRRAEELQKSLPRNLRDTPVVVDPELDGTTVQVRYTHNDKGVITGVEIHVGPDAGPRHIQDHVPTVRAMRRYQGVAGRARALVQRFTSWLTGNPKAGPGTLAWETKREVEKLTGIIENRQKQLEDPNLTPEKRKERENELDSYEKQLAQHEKVLEEITNDPGRGYVAANSEGQVGREVAAEKYPAAARALPDGYAWRLGEDGEPYVVRDPVNDKNGNPRPILKLNVEAAKRGETDPKKLFEERKIQPAKFDPKGESNPSYKPTPAAAAQLDALAQARRDAIASRTKAENDVTQLAEKLGLDPKKVMAEDGYGQIEAARANPNADQALVEQLAKAREDLTNSRRDLTRASEQLGNTMALDYMDKQHPNATRMFPPKNADGSTDLPPGTSGEFDMVYVEGNPPNEKVIVVEAKGASSKLGVSERAGAEQGSPQYLDYIAGKMQGSADPALREALDSILNRGLTGGSEVSYILVEAPANDTTTTTTDESGQTTTTGGWSPGRVREFKL